MRRGRFTVSLPLEWSKSADDLISLGKQDTTSGLPALTPCAAVQRLSGKALLLAEHLTVMDSSCVTGANVLRRNGAG